MDYVSINTMSIVDPVLYAEVNKKGNQASRLESDEH
jgi:hypothetical protein